MKTGNVWQDFEWEVDAAGYRWMETRRGLALVPAKDEDAPDSRAVRYRPFSKEHSGLFTSFARLDGSPDAVLSFANRYGLLGPPVLWNFWEGEPVSVPGSADGSRWPSELARHITDVGGFAGELLTWDPSGPVSEHWCWTTQIRALSNFLRDRELLASEPLLAGSALIANQYLAATAAPYLEWSHTNRLYHLRLRPQSLLGALWLQAALAIAENKTFRNCPVCSRPIEISRSGGARTDAMFCSNACKSRDYRKRRAEARKLADKRWKPAQIAKKLRTDASTVRKWLR